MTSTKRESLVCYDYGTGGLWGVFRAHSADEITEIYPELVIADEWPRWMTEKEYEGLRDREMHEVSGAPWGIINAVLADREK